MEVTSMSSRGQIVIPQKIRENMQITEGQKFAVIGQDDFIIMKKIKFEGFEEILRKTRGFVKENKINESEIEQAIKKARSK